MDHSNRGASDLCEFLISALINGGWRIDRSAQSRLGIDALAHQGERRYAIDVKVAQQSRLGLMEGLLASANRNDIPEAKHARVTDLLNARLADAIDLRLQAKQAHWNAKGPSFLSLHAEESRRLARDAIDRRYTLPA